MEADMSEGMDRTVVLNPTQRGLEVSVPCQECLRRRKVLHPWTELQAMLQGQRVVGVQPVQGGWVVTVPCASDCQSGGARGLMQNSIQYRLARAEIMGFLGR
jgi:hypothetical protein